jgi:hypothetical protein
MRSLFFFCSFSILASAFGQQAGAGYHIKKTAQTIAIDGKFNDPGWKNAELAGDFVQHFPYDTCASKARTEFMLAYDDKALYCAFICYDKNPDKDFVLQSLKRDFSINNNDAIVISLSTFLDGQNGFSFGVTPENSQREGVIENGGNYGVTTAWDQIWYSATRRVKDTWFAEFAIPLKSIRFADDNATWDFNIARADFKNNEVSTWVKVPRNFNISQLSFCRKLLFPEPPKRLGENVAIVPYVSNLSTGNAPYSRPFAGNKIRVGGDAKIALSTSLNLDITVNPDFAQVEVDEQQINLTRFSLFFPERRQFFLENSDLFANFGFRQIRPFFSRRIGLGSTGNIPIDAGARVTGKIGNNWRIGAMAVQTRDSGILEPGSKNYFVAALQRKVFASSNIGFILVNDMDGSQTKFGANRRTVSGLEYNLQSKQNRWVGKAFVQKAFGPDLGPHTWAHASYLNFQTLKWQAMWNHEYVGKDFKARTGFVPRIENFDPVLNKIIYLSYWRLEPMLIRTFYPKSKTVNHYSFQLYNSSYYDSMFRATESLTSLTGRVVLQNSAELRSSFSHNYQNIYVPFSPIKTPGIYFLGAYTWYAGSVGFTSNNRKKVNGAVDLHFGNYFTGTRYAIGGNLQWRRQPWGVFSVTFRRESIELGNSIPPSILNLVGAKADISFTTTMYFTAFLQYNTQAENVNINLRYQWRFRPMSDIFVVYSENYLPEFSATSMNFSTTLNSKNRSIAVKLVYWFNT